jgi:hypothetical protein
VATSGEVEPADAVDVAPVEVDPETEELHHALELLHRHALEACHRVLAERAPDGGSSLGEEWRELDDDLPPVLLVAPALRLSRPLETVEHRGDGGSGEPAQLGQPA